MQIRQVSSSEPCTQPLPLVKRLLRTCDPSKIAAATLLFCAVRIARLRYVQTPTRALRAPTIRLRDGACDRLREIFGCTRDYEVAEQMDVDPTQLSRIQTGRADVGPSFLARVLIALAAKGVDTADLFEVVDVYGYTAPMTVACPAGSARRLTSSVQRLRRRAS